MEDGGGPSAFTQAGKTARGRSDCHFRHPACVENDAAGATFRQPLGHRRPSTTATIVGPSAVSGSAFSRKWRPPVQFLTSFPSTAAMSRRTARRLVQKGGVRGSDWPFARRKNEQNPCFGR